MVDSTPSAAGTHGSGPPSGWIVRWSALVPAGGRVLDVASGAGRHSRWFAERGCRVTAIDRDPAALARLALTVPAARRIQADIEREAWPLPGEAFDAVVVTHYLWRPLWSSLKASVAPGGIFLMETFVRGHEHLGRPTNPDFLLREGELLQVFADWSVVAFEEGRLEDPARRVQRIAVRAPGPTPNGLRPDAPLHWPISEDDR